MAQISMEARGRYGQLFAAAVQKKDLSLRDIAAKLDYSYEQIRKFYIGTSFPSKLALKELCKMLDINEREAEKAVAGDRMERKYGASAYNVLGRDPRTAQLESLLPQLNNQEWDMFVSQLRGYVHEKRKKS